MTDTLIKVDNVSKKFCRNLKKSIWYGVKDICVELRGKNHWRESELRQDEFWALKNVSFELRRGECLGLIGPNGAGKTTLLRMLNGLIRPDSGQIDMQGRVGALIALGAGFNPILTGRENIYVSASILGLKKQEIENKIDEIIAFSEIEEFIDSPVQSYSSGMHVKLGFAISSTLTPDILILDEVLAVGDANFQSKCFQRIGKLVANSAVILVSHYPHHIKKMCDQVLLLERGIVVEHGPPDKVLATYSKEHELAQQKTVTLLGGTVKSAYIEKVSATITTGNYLQFDFVIDLISEIFCDLSYLNLVDKGEIVHATVVLDGLKRMFTSGINRQRIRVGPLHLSTGRYKGHFSICSDGGKKTVAHLRHCLHFDFEGETNLGAFYYPPSQVNSVIK